MKTRTDPPNGSPAGEATNGHLRCCKDLALRLYGPPWRSPCEEPGRRLYQQFFDPPALSDEAEARRAAERFREDLRTRFGEGVPQQEVDSYKEGFLAACKRPDAEEGHRTGYRAGLRYKQRQRADAPEETPSEDLEVFEDAAEALEWYATGGPTGGGGPRPATVPISSLPASEQAHIERCLEQRRAAR